MKMTVILIIVATFETVPKGLEKETGGIVDQRKNEDYSDPSTVKISLDTCESSGNLTDLLSIQDISLKLLWKTCIEEKW